MAENQLNRMPVRVELTTSFEVDKRELDDPDWELRVRLAQERLGELAGAFAGVRVKLSVTELNESSDKQAVEVKNALESEKLSDREERLATDITKLLVETQPDRPGTLKTMGGFLAGYGLNTVVSLLATGKDRVRMLEGIGDRTIEVIERAIDTLKLDSEWTPSPTIEDLVTFCRLEDVPGIILAKEQYPGVLEREYLYGLKPSIRKWFDMSFDDLALQFSTKYAGGSYFEQLPIPDYDNAHLFKNLIHEYAIKFLHRQQELGITIRPPLVEAESHENDLIERIVINQDVLDSELSLLLAAEENSPSKQFSRRLEELGLSRVRDILVIGKAGLERIDGYGQKTTAVIEGAMHTLGLEIPSMPTARDVAQFCSSLGQVPGRVVLQQELPLWPGGDRFSLREAWTRSGILKLTLQQLFDASIEDMASRIAAANHPEGLDIYKSAKLLDGVVAQYCFDFLTVRHEAEQ